MTRATWMWAWLLLASAPLVAAEPEGFGKLRWADPVPSGWKLAPGGGGQICAKGGWGASFGAAPLSKVEYEFVGGRLVGVALFAKDRAGFQSLRREAEARYGTSGSKDRVSPASEVYRWTGATTYADLYFLGEGLMSTLFLSWVPGPGSRGGDAATVAERRLQDRLRLCATIAEVLDKNADDWARRASPQGDYRQSPNTYCEGRAAVVEERAGQAVSKEQSAAFSKSQGSTSERARLQKEIDRLTEELASLRAKRTATGAASPSPPPVP